MAAVIVFLVARIAACDRAEAGTGKTKEPRCHADGLCWQATGKRSFEGAFRDGSNEIKFDAIFSPSRTSFTHFRDEWSFRLIDSLGNSFFEAPSSHPPASWLESMPLEMPPQREQEKAHVFARMRLVREAAQALLRTPPPAGALQKPWLLLQHHMRVSFESPLPQVRVEKVRRKCARVFLQPGKKHHLKTVEHPPPLDLQDLEAENDFSGEALLDDLSPHEELAEGVTLERSISMGLASTLLAVAGSDGLALSSEAPTHVTRPMIFPAEIVAAPGKEFQQDIDLYWKPSRSFFQGRDTRKHHTAACIKLKQRDLGSKGAWEEVKEVCTANHGFQAGSSTMTRYAKCRHLPITREYYAWKGECSSAYPKHFCNDDTALQIYHAHGEWDGGKACARTYRTRRPWCDKPW